MELNFALLSQAASVQLRYRKDSGKMCNSLACNALADSLIPITETMTEEVWNIALI